jgi:hypothetical protein
MISCIQCITIEQISEAISIATPIILLIWFYYSQKQTLSKNYFDTIDGIYAGYTEPANRNDKRKGINAGIIMNIRDTDDKGFFKGELDFAELEQKMVGNTVESNNLSEGIFTFIGKIDFEIYIDKSRHPFKPKENRIYKGTLYFVDRLDFVFESYNIETYLSAEYDIVHYREMQTLKFTLKKTYRPEFARLPESFVLYKKMGFDFEPYKNVKMEIFKGKTRVDN